MRIRDFNHDFLDKETKWQKGMEKVWLSSFPQ